MWRCVGLDLAGSPRRTTGGCLLRGPWRTTTRALGSDDEVLAWTMEQRPDIVSIDAPLSLPRGRASLDIPSPPHFRACDLELRRLGIPFFPITLGPMRMLTARGIRLKAALGSKGLRVVESYPGGVQDMMGWGRKNRGVERLRRTLVSRGFRGDVERKGLTHDELDAVACAWVGRLCLEGRALRLGDPGEGELLLPSLDVASPQFRRRLRARETPAPRDARSA